MLSHELNDIFHMFKKGHADVLIATTILENGIDVPNANTIIIDRADRFGLADLYQLRGRVGRWNRKAYAYFLTKKDTEPSLVAKKRLNAISALGGYGGGMKIALRDLEIRGSGDILGTEQSGQISSIGFHLYCKLLKRTIDTLQGKEVPQLLEVKLEFPHDARIPEEYIEDPALRMDIYQRFGESSSLESIDKLIDEVKDRFGKLPIEVIWLYHFMRIRVIAAQNSILSLQMKDSKITFKKQQNKKIIQKTISVPKQKVPKVLKLQLSI